MSKELKPCPFCGREAMDLFGYNYHKVGCSNVNCDIYGVAKYPDDWNTRVYENVTVEMVRNAVDLHEQNMAEIAELREALMDVIDGYPDYDLVDRTGLSLDRCKEIWRIAKGE
ncbi:hypothetical protein NVP1226O_51 [Vibrio phage 1.226.O._10N.261.48.E5]|nr:hypothetical protein NVP1226O_51 [Vibrio phage 1.226.O._10N.261.48.E5]